MKLFNRISALRGANKGRRVFILGNGPSINHEDLSCLSGELIIGMNASTLLEQRFGFVQDYYVVSDRRFLLHEKKREWGTSRLNDKTIRVLRRELRDIDEPILEGRTKYVRALKRDGYSRDLSAGYHFGCTTTMLAIQLAGYLGCAEIYLLGVDLRYSPEQPRFYTEDEPQMEDSFTSVQIWNIANAHRVLEAEGVKLFNCSQNSLLCPYVPTVAFDSIFFVDNRS
ncbi:conserved hypothetical protein [Cupriavidus taiwanensis]|uniref:6-hydroxymethylpterin diphosphokinase MptE-like domain-containing protein n=1 Tax=Cupriavidus taiwanensis TaxID=164546 RepID=A0A375E5V3_9BURK|nr:6-hydroxymethylpterin diphosphokinase MptE-like protein [Cupriavidus taiwanensis]SOZ64367.1 conserved hypothetical protein [Cupriavidus taiwanensis]SOZ68113.1 conserved hypothetical protein [Cupriavidus taiwanensis]SPA07925.1 conserved hypothetical protein [Cupriavidus taiwanensis]